MMWLTRVTRLLPSHTRIIMSAHHKPVAYPNNLAQHCVLIEKHGVSIFYSNILLLIDKFQYFDFYQATSKANLWCRSARKAIQYTEWHWIGETRVPYTAKSIAAQRVVEKLGCISIDALLDLVSH